MPAVKTGTSFLKKENSMKLKTRCFPLGALPYSTIQTATKMIAKFFAQMPYLAVLPNLSAEDSVLARTLCNIPGISIKDTRVTLNLGDASYKQGMLKLDKAFNNPTPANLEPFKIEVPFLEKYLQIIKKFQSANAVVNLIGPFTISQLLTVAADEHVLVDKNFRKLFVQSVCVKALWMINKIKEYCPTTVPIIVLEESLFGQLGNIKRENEEVTVDLVTNMFAKVIEKIKSAGGLVAVQCLDKCDWKIPINAGVDIISFDAYNNYNNLTIIPEKLIEFISRGGKINWGIVPVMTEAMVRSLNIDFLTKRLFGAFENVVISGVPERFIYNSSLVSIQDNVDKLPVLFAEKAIILSSQLSKRIPFKS